MIPFEDDVPQFIQTLFKNLTNEDLRELTKPIARDNKITKKLVEQHKSFMMKKLTRKATKRRLRGIDDRSHRMDPFIKSFRIRQEHL